MLEVEQYQQHPALFPSSSHRKYRRETLDSETV